MAAAHPASAVLSSLALKGVLESSQSAFEQVVGRIDLRFDATQAILERLAQGARADLLILTSDALEDLRRRGEVTQVRALGSSGVGLAVRAGAALLVARKNATRMSPAKRVFNSVVQTKAAIVGAVFNDF